MILQLRESQPAVPQTDQISQTRLPVLTENNDVEDFITILEMCLISAGTPRIKWKHHLLTQLTQSAKLPILSLLEDDTMGFEDIKHRLPRQQP